MKARLRFWAESGTMLGLCGLFAVSCSSLQPRSDMPVDPEESGASWFVADLCALRDLALVAHDEEVRSTLYAAAAEFLVPDWWTGDLDHVSFKGWGFSLSEPGFWGSYQGVWIFRCSPGTTWAVDGKSPSQLNLDGPGLSQTTVVDRPDRGISRLYIARQDSRSIVVGTSLRILQNAISALSLDPPELSIGGLCLSAWKFRPPEEARTLVQIWCSWSDLLAGKLAVQSEGPLSQSDIQHLIATDTIQHLGISESSAVPDTREVVRLSINLQEIDIMYVLWVLHDFVGFRTFI